MPPRRKANKPSLQLVLFPTEITDSCPPDDLKGFRNINNQFDKTIESVQQYRECRICLQNQTINNKMISACRCLGSVRFVHEECLQQWIQRNIILGKKLQSVECQICKCPFQYEIIRVRKCDKREQVQRKIVQNPKVFVFLLFLLMSSFSITCYLIAQFVFMLNRSIKTTEIAVVGLALGLLIIIDGILITLFVSDFGYSVKWEVGKVKGNVENTFNQEQEYEQKRKNGRNKQNRSISHLTDLTLSPLQHSSNQIVPMVAEVSQLE